MRLKGLHIVLLFALTKMTLGQTVIAVHDFETTLATPTLSISTGTPTYITGSSLAADRPATSPFFSGGARAWGESNTSSLITFSNQSLAGYTNCYVTFRLASFSITTSGNGADAGDIVTTEISVDGGTTFFSTVRVLGNSNAYWAFSATGNATTTYDGNVTPVDFAPAGGGSRTTDGYSTVRVDIPVTETQVMIRITQLNNTANEKWCIDDLTIYGTSTCTPPPTPTSPTAAANPSCVATTLNTMVPTAGETWYWQGTNASGTSTASPTSSTYSVSVSGTYYVRAQDNSTFCWSTVSSSIVMVINSSPSISSHPANANVSVGSNATFTLTASGGGLTYQWQEDQGGGFVNISDGGIYSGCTTNTLTLSGVTLPMDTWEYQCIVTGACSPSITSNPGILSVVTTSVGDYRTIASGNWAVNTTWEKWNGSAWVACTVGDFPDLGTANAEIRTHTVDLDGSGSPPFDCNNLVIQTGGILWANHFTSANAYLQIYGNITCDGRIGVSTGDDICFDIAGGTNCTISGAGTFYATRIRKDGAINAASNTTLTIDMNIFLFWSTGSGTILYNDGTNAIFDITVNAGRTLRGITAGAVSNNVSMDGVAGADATACGGSYTIFGTIDIDGTFYATTNNVNLTRPISTTIKNGGVLKCAYITTSASGVATSTLTIESGGKLTLSAADGSSNTFSSFSTTNNIYNLNTGSTVEFTGTVAQNVESQLTYSNITFNGSGLKTLNGATTVNGLATFTSGLVASTAVNLLNMSSTSSTTGANNSGFVNGPVNKTGSTNFIFPIGKDNVYRPISITSLTGSETFTAEYFHADPDAVPYDVTLMDATLNNIGRCEYWILNRAGSVNANVTLSWNTYSCGVTSLPDLAVTRWDGSMWKDHGNGGTTGTTSNGTVVTTAAVTSFSPFTLASRTAGVNPLPIELLSFTANYNSSNKVNLKWITASETNNDFFTIERSKDGVFFNELNVVDGAGNSTGTLNYSTIDNEPLQGLSYYRLKQTDFNGENSYSTIVSVEKNQNGFEIINTQFNQSQNQLAVYFICDNNCTVSIELFDLKGKKIYSSTENTLGKNSEILIPISNISEGIYLIKAFNAETVISKKIKL